MTLGVHDHFFMDWHGWLNYHSTWDAALNLMQTRMTPYHTYEQFGCDLVFSSRRVVLR